MPTRMRRRCNSRAEPAAAGSGPERVAVDVDLAILKALQAVDAAQERALPAARGADHDGHLTAPDGKRHAIEDARRAVALHQPADLDHAYCRSSRFSSRRVAIASG